MGGVNPGAKAGFFGGAAYGLVMFVFVALSLTVAIPLGELSRLIGSMTGISIPEPALMALVAIGAAVVLVITIVLGILFGLLYNWLCEKVDHEWRAPIALLVGSLLGLLLGLTTNVPLNRAAILAVTIIYPLLNS